MLLVFGFAQKLVSKHLVWKGAHTERQLLSVYNMGKAALNLPLPTKQGSGDHHGSFRGNQREVVLFERYLTVLSVHLIRGCMWMVEKTRRFTVVIITYLQNRHSLLYQVICNIKFI